MSAIDAKWFMRKRYFVGLMMCFGFAMNMLLRTNLSMAIVEMTSNKTVLVQNETHVVAAEFHWNSIEKGVILSSFSWGFLFSLLGGIFARRFGAATVFGCGILITALITALTPFIIRLNMYLYIAFRIVEGMAEGISVASGSDLIFYWSPLNERARFTSLVCLGFNIAPIFSYPLSGIIANLYGWEAVFFVPGGISLVWFLLWSTCASNSPNDDNCISVTEKNYLKPINDFDAKSKSNFSWKNMLTSKAVWAFVNEKFVESWSYSFVDYCIPLFIKDMQSNDINEIGLLSAIPHTTFLFGMVLSSYLIDFLRARKILTITNVHKLFISFAQMSCIITLIMLSIWMDSKSTIIFLSVFRFCFSIAHACYLILPMDMGKQDSSFLNGFSLTAMSIGYILNPLIMGFMVKNHTLSEWRTYFMFLGIFNVWGSVIFFFFGSGDPLPWITDSISSEKTVTQTTSKCEDIPNGQIM